MPIIFSKWISLGGAFKLKDCTLCANNKNIPRVCNKRLYNTYI